MTLRLEDIQWDGLFPAAPAPGDSVAHAALHRGRDVLLTGAGGSIGAALCKAVHRLRPRTLALLDSSEQNLYYIHRDLASLAGATTVVPVLGSVADERSMRDLFARFRPHIVYHAAALKHVPLGEMNPFAVIENNVFGTSTLATVAREFAAEHLLMISTDKSVNPLSIMGASKRLAEMLLQSMDRANTRMTSIRLGNVLGSEGSVVPLFLEQIARGGPVTVTDPDVERYFLTVEATVDRILAAVANCPPGPAIAVPVMGEPVKIADLARFLIQQADAQGVEISFTGLRPGDKMQEEFIAANETVVGDAADGLRWVQSAAPAFPELAAGLVELETALEQRDLASLLAAMTRLVPEYQPSAFLREQIETAAR
jgi:FlaA1/EpsC-like NDP-sugar epimerase